MSAVEAVARKAVPRTLNAFCCGCSLDVGVKVVTLLHVVINLFVLVAIASDLIGGESTFAIWYENDMTVALFLAGFLLCGIPVILAAFYGTFLKSESLVRVYWYYAVVSYIILCVVVVRDFVISGPCETVPVLVNGMGTAVTCGVFRIVNALAIVGMIVVPLYFLFVVLSYCDNLAFGISGPGLHDLAAGSDHFYRPWLYQRPHDDQVRQYVANVHHSQVNGYGDPQRGGGYGAVYEEAASQGLGGSQPIFSRGFHDLTYPRATNAA